MPDPHQTADDAARALAAGLLDARHAALGTLVGGGPMVTRVAVLWLPGQGMGMLLSDLSDHARALAGTPAASLLLGEVVPKGDPMAQPRLTLIGQAACLDKAALRESWLAVRPKARLYFDFADFRIWCLRPESALLNAGFGRAHRLLPTDLGLA